MVELTTKHEKLLKQLPPSTAAEQIAVSVFDTHGILAEDLAFQNEMLQQVSRTFALTIPELPQPLATIVGNAYLWCRLADTIEDESCVSVERRADLLGRLAQVLAGEESCEAGTATASEMTASVR